MNAAIRELDARALPPSRRHPEIFSTFDALSAGEAFVLVDDHEPKPLLYQFQLERPGAFEWSVLEAGPAVFRVEIRRRAAATPRGVREYLGEDNRRLGSLLRDAARLAHEGSFAAALRSFAEFRCGLARHVEMEEQVLFPELERLTGRVGGPTAVLKLEHREIHRLSGAIGASLQAEDLAGVLDKLPELASLLEEHNAKEENVLYPTVDRAAGGDRERDELVQRMQRL